MATKPAGQSGPKSQEQIIAGFNQLRQDQRALASKVVELESEQNEHSLVIDALKDVDGDRKCFRMIGGVLVERTVKDVLPPLVTNQKMITTLIDNLKSKVVDKGKEINDYMDKNNIQIKQESTLSEAAAAQQEATQAEKKAEGSSGVLVAKSPATS